MLARSRYAAFEGLTRKHGVVCVPPNEVTVEDIVIAVGNIIGLEKIRAASRMNKRLVIYSWLKSSSYMKLWRPVLNAVFTFCVDNHKYQVYASTETLKCFGCGNFGHLKRFCPQIAPAVAEQTIPPDTVTENVPSTLGTSEKDNVWDGFTLVSSLRKRKTLRDVPPPRKENKVVLDSDALDSVPPDKTSMNNRYEILLNVNADPLPAANMDPQPNVEELHVLPPDEATYFDAELVPILFDGVGTLTPKQRTDLESPLTLEELYVALKSLDRGKSPGLDGLPVEFFEKFWDLIGPELLLVFLESLKKGSYGPLRWPKIFPECDRPDQSPINILSDAAISQPSFGPLQLQGWTTASKESRIYNDGRTDEELEGIPVTQFPKHMESLHVDGQRGFGREFEEIQQYAQSQSIMAEETNRPDNKNKNRYVNIMAFDHTRVKLRRLGRERKGSDYINANFVDGYNAPRAYIATQGPLKATFADFWRMVWEHDIRIVIMITNLVEKGRRKCDPYWPMEGSEEYGTVVVTLRATRTLACYTVRRFTLLLAKPRRANQRGVERTVLQFQYTSWPDMGTPEHALPLLAFVRTTVQAAAQTAAQASAQATLQASSKSQTRSKKKPGGRVGPGPVVVHCSAGVGRTGTYIVLASMLQQMKEKGTIGIKGFLKHIRTQRNFLVQTEEQYIFLHEALLEAARCHETDVPAANLSTYLGHLLGPSHSGQTRLHRQFKVLTETPAHVHFSSAQKECNISKNRNSSILPAESSQVELSTLPKEDGADYINASFVMGYRHLREYIVTQLPLAHTMRDFWRMIWEHNIQLILMLPSDSDQDNEAAYWPRREDTMAFDGFRVTTVNEDRLCLSHEENVIIRDLILESTQDDYVLEVRHLRCPRWPDPDGPLSGAFELVHLEWQEAASREGPVVLQDEFGGATAGMFYVLSMLARRLEEEGSVDVYRAARTLYLARPEIFSDAEQLRYLYAAVQSLVDTRDSWGANERNGTLAPAEEFTAEESMESLV
uniref:receptor-type tyrosine-protein phosphatase gamma-like n=1 Tax=Myxine glutinosa TaxID=7769 RepID=UPI00358EE8F5